jgi:hypothetical protein
MKRKFFIIIVLIVLLTSSLTVVGKPSWKPDQSYLNGEGGSSNEFRNEILLIIALKLLEKNGWIPQGILEKVEIGDIR